jgi:hypothetical protein
MSGLTPIPISMTWFHVEHDVRPGFAHSSPDKKKGLPDFWSFFKSPWQMGNLSFFICTSPWFRCHLTHAHWFWRLISLNILTTGWQVCGLLFTIISFFSLMFYRNLPRCVVVAPLLNNDENSSWGLWAWAWGLANLGLGRPAVKPNPVPGTSGRTGDGVLFLLMSMSVLLTVWLIVSLKMFWNLGLDPSSLTIRLISRSPSFSMFTPKKCWKWVENGGNEIESRSNLNQFDAWNTHMAGMWSEVLRSTLNLARNVYE